MINVLVLIIAFGVGIYIGMVIRDLKDRIKTVENKLKTKQPDVGATRGNYAPVNEYTHTNQDSAVGIVETKTPQRLDWEAQQDLAREARGQ